MGVKEAIILQFRIKGLLVKCGSQNVQEVREKILQEELRDSLRYLLSDDLQKVMADAPKSKGASSESGS